MVAQADAVVREEPSDEALVAGARRRDEAAVRALTTRYNRRLFRIARSIVGTDHEAEDVVQETYVRAFTQLDTFRGEASFGTWLVRIAMNEALGRQRRRRPQVEWDAAGEERLQAQIIPFPGASATPDPEQTMAHREIQTIIEGSIDELPEAFRTVFVARMVEGMSVEETAALLHLRPETVKTRLHRARARLRENLDRQLGPMVTSAFPFDGARCARMTEAVVHRLGLVSGNLS